MGWEWRCFVPMTEDTPDLLPSLDANAIFSDAEYRSDIYLPLTADLGLKKRGGGKIELKQRSSRDEHGCENWSKSVGKSVKSVLGSLPSHLQVSEVRSAANKQWVTLEKSRTSAHIVTGVTSAVKFEQTDIQVEVDGRQAGRWRSFCVETSNASTENGTDSATALAQFIAFMPELQSLSRNISSSNQTGMVGGYPEFVASVLSEELAPTEDTTEETTEITTETALAPTIFKVIKKGDVRTEPSSQASSLGRLKIGSNIIVSEFHTSPGDGRVWARFEWKSGVSAWTAMAIKDGIEKLQRVASALPFPPCDEANTTVPGQELWMVRHGERIDETPAYRGWRLNTPSARHFDPPLTDQGAEQARTAAAGLAALGAPQFSVIYSSPCMRTLSTAHELAKELGIKEVRTVFGLAYCAAAVRQAGPRYRNELSFLPMEKMRTLCPELTGDETDAPDSSFEEACGWLCSGGATRTAAGADAPAAAPAVAKVDTAGRQPAKKSRMCETSASTSAADEVADDEAESANDGLSRTNGPVLVVTHREGIRDLLGKHVRLPYCAIARFGVSAATDSPDEEGGAPDNDDGKQAAAGEMGTTEGAVEAAGLRFHALGLYTPTSETIKY